MGEFKGMAEPLSSGTGKFDGDSCKTFPVPATTVTAFNYNPAFGKTERPLLAEFVAQTFGRNYEN